MNYSTRHMLILAGLLKGFPDLATRPLFFGHVKRIDFHEVVLHA